MLLNTVADTQQVFYLYLIEDIYSRKAMGWEVGEAEECEKTAALLQRGVIGGIVFTRTTGAALGQRSANEAGDFVEQSARADYDTHAMATACHQRPSLFRVAVHNIEILPARPTDGFASQDAARTWVRDFMCWYNNAHRRSRIRFVTPAERIKS